MYAIYPLKSRRATEFLNFLQLLSPYAATETIVETVTVYSNSLKALPNIHKCHIIERTNSKDMPLETYMKYYPTTLIWKKALKVNAKACNKFMFKPSEREIVPSARFMVRSGYAEDLKYHKSVNEFYFDTFDSCTKKVDEPITISIFKIRQDMKVPDNQIEKIDPSKPNLDISVDEKFQGKKVFEKVPSEDNEENKEEQIQADQPVKMYVVELKGY